jgi:hypothetical protein
MTMKSEASLLLELNDTIRRLENALSREKQLETSLEIARKTIMRYERENSKLRGACLFYKEWNPMNLASDKGKRAREALGE